MLVLQRDSRVHARLYGKRDCVGVGVYKMKNNLPVKVHISSICFTGNGRLTVRAYILSDGYAGSLPADAIANGRFLA